jgi:hypothetical protein
VTVLMRHALANAAVPIVTVIGIGIALLIGGVVVTESVYAIPGLGRLTVDAVLARDFPTIQGVILLFSFVYVMVNLLVDLSYVFFDPTHPLLMPMSSRPDFEALSVESATVVHASSVRGSACGATRRCASAASHAAAGAGRAGRAAGWARSTRRCSTPASRDLLPGKAGEITTLEGEHAEAPLPDGQRQLRPRHLQPRDLRHPACR